MLDPRREGRVTGSMCGAAMGVNKYTSRQKAWRLITKREVFLGNEFTEHGINHEKDAILAYEVFTGNIVDKANEDQEFIDFGKFGVTPDGFSEGVYIEAKAPQNIPDAVPSHYMSQVQLGMQASDTQVCHLVYWTEEDLVIFEIERSEEYWAAALPLLEEFNEYLAKDEKPARKKKPILPEVKTRIIT